MSGENRTSGSKVARLIDRYELSGVGEEMAERWTREEDRNSLRDLAEWFNAELLRAALSEAGLSTVAGEVENYHRLLTDEQVTSGTRAEVSARLERRGLDVDQVTADFVSYQAIRTYLKSHREVASPDLEPRDPVDRNAETIRRLQSRLRSVTENSLSTLAAGDDITLGTTDVLVSVTVHCTDCDTQRTISELLAAGGCRCSTGATDSNATGEGGHRDHNELP